MSRAMWSSVAASVCESAASGRNPMRLKAAAALVTCALIVGLLAAPAAMAAESATPKAGGTIDLQAWPDNGRLIVVVAITVPADSKLPATVRVPVPEGANVQWVGEVFGGDLSADRALPYEMVKSPVGGRYAEFTLEQTRSAQVDAEMPALTQDGDGVSASFEWIQATDSPFTSFSIRVPASASNVKISPPSSSPPEPNAAGELLYSGDPTRIEPGGKQLVEFSYSTLAPPPATAGGSGSPLIFAFSVALVVAVAAFIVVIVRQRQGGAPPVSEDQDEEASGASDDTWDFVDED